MCTPSQRPSASKMDDEALIAAVLALRRDSKAETAVQAFAALQVGGENAELTLSQVKRACSKATKRHPKTAEASENAAPETNSGSAKQAKQQKQTVSAMKAAETAMMRAQRLLRLKKAEDDVFAEETRFSAIMGSDRGEAFIQQSSGRALSAQLEDGDATCLEQRVEADLATLEWMLLAEAAGTLVLPDDARTSARGQAARLKAVRGAKDRVATLACFINGDDTTAPPVPGPVQGDYLQSVAVDDRAGSAASLDRAIWSAGALSLGATGTDPMDDVD